MHSRVSAPATPARPRHVLRGLVCTLVLGWAGKSAAARLKSPRTVPPEQPTTYLLVTGPLPLRFQPAPPAPEATARPAGSGPPFPVAKPAEPAIAPPPATTLSEATPAPADVILPPVTPAKTDSPPIIPDDTRRRVQAEDFLPFFQFPGSPDAPSVQLVVPPNPPHHATPSTATYRQQ